MTHGKSFTPPFLISKSIRILVHCSVHTAGIFVFKFSFSSISERKEHIAEITPTSVTHGRTLRGIDTKFAAAHAVDKDLSTKAATHIDNGAGWLKLKFDRTYFINKIVIYRSFYNRWYLTTYKARSYIYIYLFLCPSGRK